MNKRNDMQFNTGIGGRRIMENSFSCWTFISGNVMHWFLQL